VLLKPDETQGREGMTRQQRTTSIVLFVVLLAVAMPSAAPANSLLSGYGGPGEGNQAILGSALLNTPKGGGGGSSGDAGGGGGGVSQTSGTQPSEAVAPQSAHGSSAGEKGSTARPGKGARTTKRATRGATSPAAQGTAAIYPAASREEAAGGSRALGLSGADFVYIILALGVLALTGFLTARVARTAATPDRTGASS
jgi:hypothetical protein